MHILQVQTNSHIISSVNNFIHLNYPFRPLVYATGGAGLVGGLTQEGEGTEVNVLGFLG